MRALRLTCAFALLALPSLPWAAEQSLPPGIRACAAESDAERRHACYDREVGRVIDAEKGGSTRHTPTAPPHAAAPTDTAPRTTAAASPATAAPHESPLKKAAEPIVTAMRSADRVSAKIVRVEAAPDELVMHLDNGEVWEQTDRTSGGLGLHAGDTVTIEKHLGSYWLTARHVSGMRVRKKAD